MIYFNIYLNYYFLCARNIYVWIVLVCLGNFNKLPWSR